MDKQVPSAEYVTLVADLEEDASVVASKMFGVPTLKCKGKAFASSWNGGLALKLGPADHATALGLAGAYRFDPSGKGRAMKEWVVVPAAHQERWLDLARAAQRYATG